MERPPGGGWLSGQKLAIRSCMGKQGFEPRLESLRGIAAIAVALTHGSMTFVYSPNPSGGVDRFSDWLIFFMPAGASVVLFFALSGYVLGLALARSDSFWPFMLRRLFRILPALWVATIVTFAAERLISPSSPVASYSEWFVNCFLEGSSWADLARNLFLAKTSIVPTSWSLVPEVVCSAALPFIIRLHRRLSFPWRFGMLLALASVGLLAEDKSLQYVSTFYAGFFLPQYVARLGSVLPATAGYALIFIGNYYGVPYTDSMRLICSCGAVLLIGGVVASPTSFAWLNAKPLRLIGKVSYSLYLLHPVTLYLVVVALSYASFKLETTLGNLMIAFGSIFAAVILSVMSHRYVEEPWIRFGKMVSSRMQNVKSLAEYTEQQSTAAFH